MPFCAKRFKTGFKTAKRQGDKTVGQSIGDGANGSDRRRWRHGGDDARRRSRRWRYGGDRPR